MSGLKELQAQIVQLRANRGFTTEPIRIFTLLNEEIGEIAAELKKTWSVNYESFQKEALQDEIADAMVLLLALADCYDVDAEAAIESKFFGKDSNRTWKSSHTDADKPAAKSVRRQKQRVIRIKQVVYNKLVRDKIPDIITADNRHAKTRVLDDDEYVAELKRKLAEEVEEFQASEDAGELADIIEVVYALAVQIGVNPPELEKMRQAKRDERGGFDRKIFLIESEINEEEGY